MSGFEALYPALLILIACYAVAAVVLIAAFVATLASISLWRRGQQGVAFILNIPSAVCLMVLFLFFTPRFLSRTSIDIDLTHPFDLSSIPKTVHWFPWGAPGYPDTHPGWFCCVERGNIFVRVKLLNGQVIEDECLRAFIHVDEHGIYKVELFSSDVSPRVALRRAKPILAGLLSQSTDKRSKVDRDNTEFNLEAYEYVPTSSSVRFKPPNMEVTYHFGAARTLLPVHHVYYDYDIEVVQPKPKLKPKLQRENFEAHGINYSMPFYSSASRIGNEGEFAYQGNLFDLFERKGHLTINQEDAGSVKMGDTVVVDDTGVVLVNGVLRTTIVLRPPPEN